jgi:hypothetical protein
MTTAADLTRELERTRDETVGYFSLGDTELARTYGPGKWSVLVYSVTGLRTLKDECEKVASHNEHHLGQIRAALRAGGGRSD